MIVMSLVVVGTDIGIAEKAVKEVTYHRDYAGRWFLTLIGNTDAPSGETPHRPSGSAATTPASSPSPATTFIRVSPR